MQQETVNAAGANKLAFGVQPSTTSAGSAINPAVTVIVQDQYGNTVTSDSSTVTISSGTTAFTGSTLTATASSGVATFSNIKPTTSGTSNTLTASDGSLTGVTSNTFTVNKATPTITFGTAPTPTYLGGTFTVSASTNNTDSSTLTYSYVSGPCAFVSGSTFSSSGAGTCIVQASGAATSNFNAASAQQNVAIAKATPTISVSNSPVIYNGAAQAATFTGSVGGTVSNVKYGGSSTMPTNAGTYAVTANFTPTDTTNYSSLSSASAGNFVINNPVPTTSSISPSSKTVGAAQFTMNVTGTNFVSGSVVQFNGSNRATTYLNATALSATILTSDLTTVGTFNITVFNPAPGGGYSNNQTFTLTVTSTYSLDTTYTFTETNSSSTWQSISIKDSSYADALANVSILNFTSGRWESILTNPFTGGTSPGEHVNVIKGASGNASNYDAGGGQIKIRYNWTNSTSNNSLGVDMINVTVLYSQPNFLLNITTNTTSVPVDNQYYLEINYSRDANETYSIYVWNGSAWNNRTTLNATPGNWTVMNYTLNSGENNSGKPLIRYLDNNPSGTSQGNIYIDYQRIHGITAGLPSNYYLNITTNTTNVPQAYSAELQLKYNIFGDNFTVQIMNTSSGWENVTILNATGMPYRNITLNSSWLIPDGTFSGNVASINRYYVNVRYLDVNQSVNGTLYLDYQRIYNV
ncbi:MAG: MBG domain-containing protein [Candidatus Methanoperedens sp.]